MTVDQDAHAGSAGLSWLKVAAIGGSAGSLVAMQELCASLPGDCGIAYVIIQHRSVQHDKLLNSLLEKQTCMPVVSVRDGVRLKPDHVYVAAADQFLGFNAGKLTLGEPESRGESRKPIDYFCQTLAVEQCAHAALVILSGALDDGTLGAKLIKSCGGVVMVQTPAEAVYSSMPESVLLSGHADQVLAPRAIAKALCRWGRQMDTAGAYADGTLGEEDEPSFQGILALVRERIQLDLSEYKPATLRRRIERRMGFTRVGNLKPYLQLLHQNPGELGALCDDLLIGVTAFFRDAEAFHILDAEVVPRLFEAKSSAESVRVWVAGCSTGEEAYSVAILLMRWLNAHPDGPDFQVFATDIDEGALDFARSGRFDESVLKQIPDDCCEGFFIRDAGSIRIIKEVRERIVFASHNLIADPPFSHLDLVVCRNLLIYLAQDTQQRLLDLFRFVLNPGGYLFLGSSENLGSLVENFEAVSKPWRIFRHQSEASRCPPRLPIASSLASRRFSAADAIERSGDPLGVETLYQRLIERHGPVQVLVTEGLEILYISGDATPYLRIPTGEPSKDLLKLIHPGLSLPLQSAINAAQRDRARISVDALCSGGSTARSAEVTAGVRIQVTPIMEGEQLDFLLVSLSPEVEVQSLLPQAVRHGDDWVLRQLEQELTATREDLRHTLEQARLTKEDMRAANEEVMAMNEELQSANEELESSKEELQSLNEELITSNAELEENLSETAQLNDDLNNLLASTETATLLLDGALRIRRYTPACGRLMNIIPSDIGRSVEDLARQFDDSDLVEDCRRMLGGDEVPDRQTRDRSARWYLRRIRTYRTRKGESAGVVVTFPDITELKEAAERLREHNRMLEWQASLLHRAAPVMGFDLEGRVIYWNGGAESLYGWPEEAVLGKDIHALMKTVFSLPPQEIRAQLDSAGVWKGELVHTCADGRELIIDSHWSLYRDENGKAQAIVEVNIDVTERKRAEQALRDSERRYRELVQNANSAIVRWSRDGRITFFNEYAETLFGWTAAEAIGQQVSMLLPEQDSAGADLTCLVRDLLERPRDFLDNVNQNICRDGRRIWMSWTNRAICDDQGQVVEILCVGTDISARHEAEEEVRRLNRDLERRVQERTAELAEARERAEAATVAKSAFLANMSHEIRTPMNAIMGLNHLLRRDDPTRLQSERLAKIDTAAQHLLAIINDILDISKIEAGKMRLKPADFALDALLDQVRELVLSEAETKGLAVDLEIENLPNWLNGDVNRLRQALLNFVCNAVKFTEEGRICLRAKRVESRGERLLLRFEVEDTGIGIAEDVLKGLFQAFEQADASSTRAYGGTGLGLAIARRLAELMHGQAGAESRVGQGSRFWFTAEVGLGESPELSRQQPTSNPEQELSRRHAGRRLLLAEDNPVNREVALELLKGVGLLVDTAVDGEQALAKARAGDYALVLMDVQMPVMDGLTATRAIRALPDWGERPILAMTANAFEDDRQACLDAGMDDFVPKPFEPENLFAILLRWLPVTPLPDRYTSSVTAEMDRAEDGVADDADSGLDIQLENSLMTRLATLPGLDLPHGLQVLRGNHRRYLKLLRQFVSLHRDDTTSIRDRMTVGDDAEALQLIHCLKGVAGNLGLKSIAGDAKSVEARLRGNGPPEPSELLPRLQEIERAFRALESLLDRLPDQAEAQDLAETDPEQLKALLSELQRLLSDADASVLSVLEDKEALLRRILGQDFDTLEDRVRAFDFDAALEVVSPFLASSPD